MLQHCYGYATQAIKVLRGYEATGAEEERKISPAWGIHGNSIRLERLAPEMVLSDDLVPAGGGDIPNSTEPTMAGINENQQQLATQRPTAEIKRGSPVECPPRGQKAHRPLAVWLAVRSVP